MNRDRRITFRCNLKEAETLFDLLFRIADATWSAYEREFTEPLYGHLNDPYEAHPDQPGEDHQSQHYNEEIPF
jgi:hypothetical protein